MDWTAIIIAGIPGFASLLAVVYQSRKDKEAIRADATKTIANAAAEVVQMYKARLDECESAREEADMKIRSLEAKCAMMKDEIDKLSRKVNGEY